MTFFQTKQGSLQKKQTTKIFGVSQHLPVVVLSLTVEWGVGIERQGPSYGEVVSTRDVRVQALLGRSKSPTSRSPEAVEWIMSI